MHCGIREMSPLLTAYYCIIFERKLAMEFKLMKFNKRYSSSNYNKRDVMVVIIMIAIALQ